MSSLPALRYLDVGGEEPAKLLNVLCFARIHFPRQEMRDLVVFCGLALATIGIASPQSTAPSTGFEQGQINGNTYANPALGITWELPKDWEIQNKGVSLLGDDYYVFLRVLPSGTQSQELVEFDYSTRVDTAGPRPILPRTDTENARRP